MTAYTPNLPALITALPGDHTRAPQTEFTRERQVQFIENLSVTGSARSAASAAGVSHQSAYRARRSNAHFRLAWDAALVAARASAEAVLAARAIDGVEEEVFYHGEAIATRRRYCSRLLLAHLARLDKLAVDPRAAAFAEDFDAAMARFAAGEAPVADDVGEPSREAPAEVYPEPAEAPAFAGAQAAAPPPEKNSPGPCNTRSMSPVADAGGAAEEGDGEGCDDRSLAEAMEVARPFDAPPPEALGDPAAVARCQREVFRSGEDDWWRYGADFRYFVSDGAGRWVAEPEPVSPAEAEAKLRGEKAGEEGLAGEGAAALEPVAARRAASGKERGDERDEEPESGRQCAPKPGALGKR